MTLGEFRKITEQYGDECTLCYSSGNGYGGTYPNLIDRVVIEVGSATDAEPNPVPNITVM